MSTSSSSPSPTPASSSSRPVQRVQAGAQTMRKAQQHAHTPHSRKPKAVVKLTLGSVYQLPAHVLNLNDSLHVLDLITQSASRAHD